MLVFNKLKSLKMSVPCFLEGYMALGQPRVFSSNSRCFSSFLKISVETSLQGSNKSNPGVIL